MDVQLVQESESLARRPLAILLQVQEETYLADVRNIIAEEVPDIMPPGKYSFCFRGETVSKIMEEELTLRQIVEESDDASLNVVVLTFDLPSNDNENNQGEDGLKQLSNAQSSSLMSSGSESSMRKTTLPSSSLLLETPKKVLQLRSPTTTEIRNLNIYTENEIKQGRGKDEAYKIFWNERVRKMAKNRNISKGEIYKRTNEELRLHRSKLLIEEHRNMEQMATSNDVQETEGSTKAKKMKAATVPSNISRMKIASATLESLRGEINLNIKDLEKTVDPTTRKDILTAISLLQMRLDASSSEMRKAQDALRKNLKRREQLKHETAKGN